jgi:glycosyltransferase involved in cell wall biosynthesis
LGLPLVVTITGTDVHSDLLSPDRRETVPKVLEAADAIVAFSPAIAEELLAAMPSLSEKVHIVPQGVWFPPQESWDVRKELGIPDNVSLLLLPANIRKVKRPLLAFEGTLLLREKGFDAHLLFVGSVLEDDEWERLERVIRQHEWAHFAGAVPMEKMVSVYEAADIVLNTSEHGRWDGKFASGSDGTRSPRPCRRCHWKPFAGSKRRERVAVQGCQRNGGEGSDAFDGRKLAPKTCDGSEGMGATKL